METSIEYSNHRTARKVALHAKWSTIVYRMQRLRMNIQRPLRVRVAWEFRATATARAGRMLLALTLCALSSSTPSLSLAAADQTAGEQIYRERCSVCHGQHGEGAADGYPEPISGGRSLAQLAGLIGKTMPHDSSEKCSGPDAEAVAAYIQETFLSDSK